jgi:hypothetical protein
MTETKNSDKNSPDFSIKYWEDGKHILIVAGDWDCFLRNEWLNPMINWLNLYKQEIKAGTPCEGSDRTNDLIYISTGGGLVIKTYRDVAFLNKDQREYFLQWLREHKDLLSIREVA